MLPGTTARVPATSWLPLFRAAAPVLRVDVLPLSELVAAGPDPDTLAVPPPADDPSSPELSEVGAEPSLLTVGPAPELSNAKAISDPPWPSANAKSIANATSGAAPRVRARRLRRCCIFLVPIPFTSPTRRRRPLSAYGPGPRPTAKSVVRWTRR